MKRRSESSNGEPEATKRKKDEGKEGGVRCGMEFYDRSCEELAVAMLGCVLVCRDEDGEECRGEIVEVEAYLGGEDRAAHSFNGRRSAANEAMFMPPGTAYVYSIYGVHSCFNVSSRGEGAAVLVRALCPLEGVDIMRGRRGRRRRDKELCNGPGKLCQAMAVSKQHNKVDMVTSTTLWMEMGSSLPNEVIKKSPRIGINSAGPEWAAAQLRFFIDTPFISKKSS